MVSRAQVEEFVRASFRSVWALELLCIMRKQGDRALTPDELVDGLRASHFVVSQGLENLESVGLVIRNPDGSARYCPASSELDGLVAEAEALYKSRPNAVRRLIISATSPGISAFANAFRLRKDDEK
jgi:hypothetical protein